MGTQGVADGRIPAGPPFIVRLSLWGSKTRATLLAYLWACAILATACVPAAFIVPGEFWEFLGCAAIGAMCVSMYWRALNWADDNDYWQNRD
ncbi:MAG: hypothetical protein ACREDR_44205 [Blastocatellia bacterium]